MNFVPDGKASQLLRVPYAGEARAADGWQGQDTGRSIETLKSDVVVAMGRLGGVVHGFQRGSYRVDDQDRAGVQISYSVEAPGGKMVYGRLDVAALPVRQPARHRNAQRILDRRNEAALAMALYNVVQTLRAQWVLAQLNPGYVPLMPWLLGDKGKTLTEMWTTGAAAGRLLPAPSEKGKGKSKGGVVEGSFRETP